MKRYLIDTHILLWWLNGSKELNDSIKYILEKPENQIYLSVAILWEISIKHSLGKLPLQTTLSEMISASGFELLSITERHVLELEKLPLLHHDPFDRMLVAQAKSENLTVITVDKKIRDYDVEIL